MPFTRGAREVPNQADLPPSLPDTSGWVRRAPGDVIEAGTPVVMSDDTVRSSFLAGSDFTVLPDGRDTYWTPPPVGPAPWEEDERIGAWEAVAHHPAFRKCFSEDRPLLHSVLDRLSCLIELESAVTEMGPHTYSPETHVPVERALIDEAVTWVEWFTSDSSRNIAHRESFQIIRDLAALADGAKP